MGIFSSRSKRTAEKGGEPEQAYVPAQGLHPDGTPTGELFKGMRIDAMTKEGEPLLSGQIIDLTPDTLKLGRLPGSLSFKTVPLNTAVKISGYDKKLVPISFSAEVAESTRTVFQVKNLILEQHDENREDFRLPYSAPVSLYRQDDEHLRHPEECQLVNISVGGCCVQSEYIHVEDEVLRIQIKLEDYAPLNFLGQVVRVVEHAPGQLWYGILFAQLTEQETTALNKTLYNLQMGIKRIHMRHDYGHW